MLKDLDIHYLLYMVNISEVISHQGVLFIVIKFEMI